MRKLRRKWTAKDFAEMHKAEDTSRVIRGDMTYAEWAGKWEKEMVFHGDIAKRRFTFRKRKAGEKK